MQTSAEASHPSTSSGFAGFLASLASPPQEASAPWNDDGLADDVAILSYERALRTHGQYSSPRGATAESGSDAGSSDAIAAGKTPSMSEHAKDCSRALKRASITIRLSEDECEQLRRRAAESGLTVSAYLRSCTLEVETLRAQVKEALAQLRKPSTIDPAAAIPKSGKWHHLWPFGRRSE